MAETGPPRFAAERGLVMGKIDLRTDFVSKPTPEMIDEILNASRRAPSYGMREDEDQLRLESRVAELFGMDDALLFPTCTMANQVALMCHCKRGGRVLSAKDTHVSNVEASATAAIAGVSVNLLETKRGHLSGAQVEDFLPARSSSNGGMAELVWLENTHNFAGGTVMPLRDLDEVVQVATNYCTPVHIDGARIWNAASYHECSPKRVVRGAASVAVSLNKGLGAPMGALLVGSRSLIVEAVRLRTIVGGAIRPTGILAAAGVVALETQRDRIKEDHHRAYRLATALNQIDWLEVDVDRVETNIIVARPDPTFCDPNNLIAMLAARGVLVTPHGIDGIRLVLHSNIGDACVNEVLMAFQDLLPRRRTIQCGPSNNNN